MRLDLLALAATEVAAAGAEADRQSRAVLDAVPAREARWAAGFLRRGALAATKAADRLEDRADRLDA